VVQVVQLRSELAQLHRRFAKENAELELQAREQSSKATIMESTHVAVLQQELSSKEAAREEEVLLCCCCNVGTSCAFVVRRQLRGCDDSMVLAAGDEVPGVAAQV
jgi:hypothetical protein